MSYLLQRAGEERSGPVAWVVDDLGEHGAPPYTELQGLLATRPDVVGAGSIVDRDGVLDIGADTETRVTRRQSQGRPD